MFLQIEKKLRLCFGLVLGVLILNAGISYRNIHRLAESDQWVVHAHVVLNALGELVSALKDVEAGQWGFLLTGDERSLGPYWSGVEHIRRDLAQLKQLVADNPDQWGRIPRLEQTIAAKLDELRETIRLRREEGFEASMPIVASRRGQARMDEIRSILTTMEDEEDRLLERREVSSNTRLRQAIVTFSLASLEAIALLGMVYYLLRRDNIKRERFEQDLVAAREEAEAANRAKDQFLAVLSHELRTPLTPVLLTVSALQDTPTTAPDLLPTLAVIRHHVELEARLIDDLLDVNLINRGKMRLNREIVDAHASIHQILGLCRGEIEAGQLQLVLDLSAAEHHIDADPVRFQQALWNLLKNAIKFTPGGGTIALRSRNQPGPGSAGQHLIIEVSDTGLGIEQELLSKIFSPFEQGDTTRTRRFGGLGLGLTISRSVVEAHGGRLSATSAGKGRGATFTIELATVPAPVAEPTALGGAPAHGPLKILLVEDNQAILRSLAFILSQHRHTVRAVAGLSSALEAATEEDFDLVLSDIELPDGTGLELMRELGGGRAVPGIAFSGFSSEEDIRLSRAAGFAAHLTKPIDIHTLEATIARVVPGATSVKPELLDPACQMAHAG
jgi:signal transduction histidine kinase/ActR/RegA family two-component response regulator